jgi:hypothetical protein
MPCGGLGIHLLPPSKSVSDMQHLRFCNDYRLLGSDQCSLVDMHQRLEEAAAPIFKVYEAVGSSKTLLLICHTAQRHISEDSSLHCLTLMFSGETSRMNLCQAINNALHTALVNDPTAGT